MGNSCARDLDQHVEEGFPGIVTILIVSAGRSACTRDSPMYSSAQWKVMSSWVAVWGLGSWLHVTLSSTRTLSAVKARGRMKEESSDRRSNGVWPSVCPLSALERGMNSQYTLYFELGESRLKLKIRWTGEGWSTAFDSALGTSWHLELREEEKCIKKYLGNLKKQILPKDPGFSSF